MSPPEPTNEQLRERLAYVESGRALVPRLAGETIRALLAAREELAAREIECKAFSEDTNEQIAGLRNKLADRDVQIAALRVRAESAEKGLENMGACLVETGKAEEALERERDSLRAEAARLREALKTLVDRLDFIHEDPLYKSVWIHYMVHGNRYSGPQYDRELTASKAALAATPADSAKWLEEKLAESRRNAWRQQHQALVSVLQDARKDPRDARGVLGERDAFRDNLVALISEAEQRGYERGKPDGEINRLKADYLDQQLWQFISLDEWLAAQREKVKECDLDNAIRACPGNPGTDLADSLRASVEPMIADAAEYAERLEGGDV